MINLFITLATLVAFAQDRLKRGEGRHRRRVRPDGRPHRRRDHRAPSSLLGEQLDDLFTTVTDELGGAAGAAAAA